MQTEKEAQLAEAQWWDALDAFQADCPDIPKDSKGHGYRYASLPAILKVVRPVLRRHGMVVTWSTCSAPDGAIEVKCLLRHGGGHLCYGSMTIHPDQVVSAGGRMAKVQALGAAVTYGKRYTMNALLGLEPDDDPDAASQDTKGHDDF